VAQERCVSSIFFRDKKQRFDAAARSFMLQGAKHFLKNRALVHVQRSVPNFRVKILSRHNAPLLWPIE
jgi:hypothetical protein